MKVFYSCIACLFFSFAIAQTKHAPNSKYPSFKGLVMAGYQGWFRAEGDGTNTGFSHYFRNEERCGIDMWPDVSEYKKTYETPFKNSDGSTAKLFSSYDKSTVDLHFKWMKEYGIDGVFMQRFFSAAKEDRKTSSSLAVLKNAMEAASVNERAIAIMYDLSGLKASGEDCSVLIEDWKYLVDSLKVTNQKGTKTYIHHNGKPLVTIWGVGFPDRPYNIRSIGLEKLIDFLKNDPVYGDCSVMLGVPTYFRTLDIDCVSDPYVQKLIRSVDVVMPWTVQRFTPLLQADAARYAAQVKADVAWCNDAGVEYAACIFP